MKSKFEKSDDINEDAPMAEAGGGYDPDAGEVVEVDDSGPGVATSKGSKLIVLVASAILITIVLYFFFFKGARTNKTEKLEEIPATPVASMGSPAKAENINDFPAEDYILDKPKEPELPKLPELPKDVGNDGLSGLLPAFIDLPKDGKKAPEQLTAQLPAGSLPSQQATQVNQNQPIIPIAPPVDPRKSPIIVLGEGAEGVGNNAKGGGATAVTTGVGYEKNIIKLKEDMFDSLKKTESRVVPTIVANMPNTIIQGKLLTAVLETAISTELPGSVRAIVSRDVYAEAGNSILIPRGSRLYGAYSSDVVRGQARVQIGWTRLIRPDGVDVNITFNASDQFGRSGIEGELDSRYGAVIANSVLTSVLAVTGAIIAERMAGGNQASSTTADALGNVTITGQASNKLIYDSSKSIIDVVGNVVGNTLDNRPIIRVPQGTRISIIANSDITLPNMRFQNKKSINE